MNSNENQKKGNTILLTVIAIATLLVAVVGATFAYFTATVTGNEGASSVIVNTANLGTVTFQDGSEEVKLENALPGASITRTFTISTDTKNSYGLTYGVQLVEISNGITNSELVYTLKGTKQTDNGGTLIAGTEEESLQEDKTISNSGTMNLGSGVIKPTETHKYTLIIKFKETGLDQNSNQNKLFSAKINITNGPNETYYNDANKSGTTIKPTAEGA